MDFLLAQNPDVLARLPIEKRAQIPGGLPEEMSLVEIARLSFTYDEEKQVSFLQALVELCENGELRYIGDLMKWGIKYELLDCSDVYYDSSEIDKRINSFLELAEQDKYKVAYPSDCLIHRDEFKRYLQNVHQWPIKDCLLANWWEDGDHTENEQQPEVVGEIEKTEIKKRKCKNSNDALTLLNAALDVLEAENSKTPDWTELAAHVLSGEFKHSNILSNCDKNSAIQNRFIVLGDGTKLDRESIRKRYQQTIFPPIKTLDFV